MKTYKMTI